MKTTHTLLSLLTLISIAQAAHAEGFTPPLRGAPEVRIGGGSRAVTMSLAKINLLAPKTNGATSMESPVLYWRLSKNLTAPVEVKLSAAGSDQPLMNVTLSNMGAGIHQINLSEFAIKLQPSVVYTWQTTIVWDVAQRSKDAVSTATVQYTPPSADVRKQLAKATPSQLLDKGYAYDAIAAVSAQLDAAPDNASLHEARAVLLEQMGQPDAAKIDRSGK